jgi:hypothetical protein
MNRQKQIQEFAKDIANRSITNKGIAYLQAMEAMEWADRTMIERVREKLQDSVYDRYFEMHEDYIDDFCKSLMEE